jgi:signal transduction histidine kinase
MLDDLLTYTRIGRYDNPELPVSLQETLNQLQQELMLPQGFEVKFPNRDQLLRVPEAELRIALHNLIDNAVRHHHQSEGHISIELGEQNHHLLICVIDDGQGITKK